PTSTNDSPARSRSCSESTRSCRCATTATSRPSVSRTCWRGLRTPSSTRRSPTRDDLPWVTDDDGGGMVSFRDRAGLGRAAMGERLGGYIYGTIVVLSVVVAGAKAYPHSPGHIAAFVLVTTVVFWLAHVYAHALGHSVSHDEHLSLA